MFYQFLYERKCEFLENGAEGEQYEDPGERNLPFLCCPKDTPSMSQTLILQLGRAEGQTVSLQNSVRGE